MKDEVDVLGSPGSLVVRSVSVDVKQQRNSFALRAQELREIRRGRPGLPVPNSPYGLCGCKATLNSSNRVSPELRPTFVKVEVDVLDVPSSPFSLRGRKATLNSNNRVSPELRPTFVKVEVDVLGSPSLVVRSVSVDVKQHRT